MWVGFVGFVCSGQSEAKWKKLSEQLRNKPRRFDCIAILCLSEKLTESFGYVGSWKILGARALVGF